MGREWRRHALRKCFLFVGDGISSFLGRVWDFRRVVVILGGPGSCLLIARYGEDHLDTVKVFRMGGVLSWMAIWWLTEAVPAPITALLPLALFPVTGILAADTVAKAYWNDIVVLYFGSLVVALCIERWKVHRRLALKLLLSLGSRVTSPRLLLLGFIGCTGILSMFMSNTATSIMMVPMAVAVLHKVRQRNSDGDSFPMHTLTLASQGNLPTHEEKPEPAEAESADDPNTLLHDAVIPLHPEEIPQVHLHPDRVGGGGGTGGIASMMKMNGEGGKESMAAHDPHVVQHAFVALPLTREDDRPDFIQMAEEDLGIGQGAGEGKGDVEGGKVDGEGGDQDECMTPTPGNDSGTEGGFMSFSDKMVKSRLAEMDDPVTQYCRAIVLGIAYSASIGGMGSLTAAGPNLILAGTFSKMFPEAPRISYLSWLAFGFPLAVILLGILWGVLSFIYCPPVTVPLIQAALDRSVLEREYNRLGPMKFAEKASLFVFVLLSFLWLTRNPGGQYSGWGSYFVDQAAVGDGTASAFCAILLFITPSFSGKPWQMLMDWETCRTMPWDIVLLLGGGFALSAGVTSSGLAAWIGDHVNSLHSVPAFFIPPVVALAVSFGTEFTSNNATATVLLPLLAGLSLSMDRHPLLLMLPATLACSLAFMLPIATAQNAVAYSTGFLKLRHLLLPGFFLNIMGILLITISVPTLGEYIFSVLDDPTKAQWYSDAKAGLFPQVNSTVIP
eukprot:TRINITY_DN10752_c0_g1_i1.p1 TRINITY_DN10752_c0_g1~~TRINITY_DN10752_c0_g1_i1.p1  ORF type:complete len:728 (-),score=123.25 TRINITY_DN10752_c0_g1_i1:514-2697(-)